MSRKSSQDQFGRVAAAYGSSRTFSHDANLTILESFVRGARFETAVDIGAGAGFTAFAVAPHAERVVATDVTPEMLEQVRALRAEHGAPQTETALAAAEDLPFAGGSVDLVTCRLAAHHFTSVPRWLHEVRRVLGPGGLLVIADTVSPEDPDIARWMNGLEVRRDPSHARNLTASEWRSSIERVGLRVTDSELSKVYLECEDWARRAGLESEAVQELRRDLLAAPPGAREAFGIHVNEDGQVCFHWDVLVLRAVKIG